MSVTFDHQNGRPTKQEEIAIREHLRPYYEKGLSASYTSRTTGFNVKTVLSYFDDWDKKLLEASEGDFLNRCKVTREKSIIDLEKEIELLNHEELKVDDLIQLFRNAGNYDKVEHFTKIKLKIIEIRAKLRGDKVNLINTPTLDTIVELGSRGMKFSN
jgi:hypothetical protein